jgi:hypothetical protein
MKGPFCHGGGTDTGPTTENIKVRENYEQIEVESHKVHYGYEMW